MQSFYSFIKNLRIFANSRRVYSGQYTQKRKRSVLIPSLAANGKTSSSWLDRVARWFPEVLFQRKRANEGIKERYKDERKKPMNTRTPRVQRKDIKKVLRHKNSEKCTCFYYLLNVRSETHHCSVLFLFKHYQNPFQILS